MSKLHRFMNTRVGWASLVALGVVRALEIQQMRELTRDALLRDLLMSMPDVPATTLPRLIREVMQVVELVNAQKG